MSDRAEKFMEHLEYVRIAKFKQFLANKYPTTDVDKLQAIFKEKMDELLAENKGMEDDEKFQSTFSKLNTDLNMCIIASIVSDYTKPENEDEYRTATHFQLGRDFVKDH